MQLSGKPKTHLRESSHHSGLSWKYEAHIWFWKLSHNSPTIVNLWKLFFLLKSFCFFRSHFFFFRFADELTNENHRNPEEPASSVALFL